MTIPTNQNVSGPSLQDFRSMVGEHSVGYVALNGDQQLVKVANHRTFKLFNPSEETIQRQYGGDEARKVRQALANALTAADRSLLEDDGIRRILFGDPPSLGGMEEGGSELGRFCPQPLLRREIRQVFDILHAKGLEQAGLTEGEQACVRDGQQHVPAENLRSAYAKGVAVLVAAQRGSPGRTPLTSNVCRMIAERAEAIHRAFMMKQVRPEDEFAVLWRAVFDEPPPGDASQSPYMASLMAHGAALGLGPKGIVKLAKDPATVTMGDFRSQPPPGPRRFSRSELESRLETDLSRMRKLTFVPLYRQKSGVNQRYRWECEPANEQGENFGKSAYFDMKSSFNKMFAFYSESVLGKRGRDYVPPTDAQVEALVSCVIQEGQKFLSLGDFSYIDELQVRVRPGDDGGFDVLMSCPRLRPTEGPAEDEPTELPGSTCRFHIDGDGNVRLQDISLFDSARQDGDMRRQQMHRSFHWGLDYV